MTQVNTPVVETAPAVKLTRREQLLNQYTALVDQVSTRNVSIAKIVAEINSIDALQAVTDGSVVNISIGKGETAKVVLATVIGVRVEEDGSKTYKVGFGTGFDADVKVVKAWQISLPAATEDATSVADVEAEANNV